jgi:hypothetical protein
MTSFAPLLLLIVIIVVSSMVVNGFVVLPPTAVSTKYIMPSLNMAKSKEEDLELTRQVIREYMEKNDSSEGPTATATVTEPEAVATEEK